MFRPLYWPCSSLYSTLVSKWVWEGLSKPNCHRIVFIGLVTTTCFGRAWPSTTVVFWRTHPPSFAWNTKGMRNLKNLVSKYCMVTYWSWIQTWRWPIKWPKHVVNTSVPLLSNIVVFRLYIYIYRVSQEEWTKLQESVPYLKVYRYNPKHLYPKLNGYGDNGQRSLKLWQLLHTYWLPNAY